MHEMKMIDLDLPGGTLMRVGRGNVGTDALIILERYSTAETGPRLVRLSGSLQPAEARQVAKWLNDWADRAG